MRVQVGEMTRPGPDGDPVKLKVLELREGELGVRAILSDHAASEIAAALEGRQVVVPSPGSMPPPEADGPKR